ncbi:hypothetical protein CBOM_05879 [Ceraceosorus bombacis]|uniref:Uncharacterized protein n=1 Tax=Ceraceosorus bombacis TaxID=401625 RepID=A0A0P1BQM3_9BASI|nr:hypothetical protein CBOM_05879 [Ceraceosorus bombacis]
MTCSHSAATLAKAIRHALSGSSSSPAIPITDVYAALSDEEASGHIFAELALLSAPPRWSGSAVEGDAAGHATVGLTLNLATAQLTSLQSEWHNANTALPNVAASSSSRELAGLEKAFAAVDLPRALCTAFAVRLRTLRASSSHAATILSSTALAPLAIHSRAWDASEPSLPADLTSPSSLCPPIAASQPHCATPTRRALPLFRSRKFSAPANSSPANAVCGGAVVVAVPGSSASASYSAAAGQQTSTEAEAEQGTKGQDDAADDDEAGGQGGQVQQTFVDASPKLDAVAEESDGGMVTRTTVTTVTTTDVHRMTAHEARKSAANAAPSVVAAEPARSSVVASAA